MRLTKKIYVSGGKASFGERLSDLLTKYAGSWGFIILFIFVVVGWIIVNNSMNQDAFDPFPFILLNLGLSLLAAIQAPIILMSQNREEQKDRERAELDYQINLKAENEVADMQKDLEIIKQLIKTHCLVKRNKTSKK